MANIDVTMVVDTAALAANPSDVPAACELYDSSLDSTGSTNFQVNAAAGDTVTFHIVAKDNQTAVAFSDFRYEGGQAGLFNPFPSSPAWQGTVAGAPGQVENYYIDFTANGQSYTLDPRLGVRT